MSKENNFLVVIAEMLLEEQAPYRAILEKLIKNKGVLSALKTTELIELIYYFPLSKTTDSKDYIDALADDFRQLLFVFIFSSMPPPVAAKNATTDINKSLEDKLVDKKFASDFLDFYGERLRIEENPPSPKINLSVLPRNVLLQYIEENKSDQSKWLNRLGGLGSGLILSIFGYGFLYKCLYGKTNKQLAEKIQTVLDHQNTQTTTYEFSLYGTLQAPHNNTSRPNLSPPRSPEQSSHRPTSRLPLTPEDQYKKSTLTPESQYRASHKTEPTSPTIHSGHSGKSKASNRHTLLKPTHMKIAVTQGVDGLTSTTEISFNPPP